MIPIWQMMLGVCIGVVALILARPQALPHHENRQRSRKNYGTYTTTPGEQCVICLENMENSSMTYLRCGHALHSNCWKKCLQQTDKKNCPICRERSL